MTMLSSLVVVISNSLAARCARIRNVWRSWMNSLQPSRNFSVSSWIQEDVRSHWVGLPTFYANLTASTSTRRTAVGTKGIGFPCWWCGTVVDSDDMHRLKDIVSLSGFTPATLQGTDGFNRICRDCALNFANLRARSEADRVYGLSA